MAAELPTADEVRAIVRDELRAIVAELRRAVGPVAPSGPVPLAEAAKRLGVSVKTLRRRIKAGELRATHVGRRVLVDPADLRPAPARVTRLAHDALTR